MTNIVNSADEYAVNNNKTYHIVEHGHVFSDVGTNVNNRTTIIDGISNKQHYDLVHNITIFISNYNGILGRYKIPSLPGSDPRKVIIDKVLKLIQHRFLNPKMNELLADDNIDNFEVTNPLFDKNRMIVRHDNNDNSLIMNLNTNSGEVISFF